VEIEETAQQGMRSAGRPEKRARKGAKTSPLEKDYWEEREKRPSEGKGGSTNIEGSTPS